MTASTMPFWHQESHRNGVNPGAGTRHLTVRVDAACTACGACLITCPEGALVAAPGRPTAMPMRCTGCLACVEVCPRDAITIGGQA